MGRYESLAIINHTKSNHTVNTSDQFTLSFVPQDFFQKNKLEVHCYITDLQYMCFIKYFLKNYPWHLVVHKQYNEAFIDVFKHLKDLDQQNKSVYEKAITPTSSHHVIPIYFNPLFLKTGCDAYFIYPLQQEKHDVLILFSTQNNIEKYRGFPIMLINEQKDAFIEFLREKPLMGYIDVPTFDILISLLRIEDVLIHPIKKKGNLWEKRECLEAIFHDVVAHSRSS